MQPIKRIIVTAGEPAGIGPDLAVALSQKSWPHQVVICADKSLIADRAKQLDIDVELVEFDEQNFDSHQQGRLIILHEPLSVPAKAGVLDERNGQYVLNTLEKAAKGCMNGQFDAIVTGPVHKGVINRAGVSFSGHTEFFAEVSNTPLVVMMLATEGLRTALVTTHLPLSEVPNAITEERVTRIIDILYHDLVTKFGITTPNIYVCGLNPHAGEDGCLGMEEIETITPTLEKLRTEKNYQLVGPLPADTIFNDKYLREADAVLGMYHDQVLPVLKYKGFGRSVNITLGLPFIRTSVDHGTAIDLAGTGQADFGSFETALAYAIDLVESRQ